MAAPAVAVVFLGLGVLCAEAPEEEMAWPQTAKLTASDPAAWDHFGRSVELAGDAALVGASLDNDHGTHSGSAYLFVRSAGAWKQQAKLVPEDGEVEDHFGWSVAVSGDTALIGTIFDDDNGDDSGSAYVFVRDGDVWIEKAKLLPGDGAELNLFGYAVSLSGDTALIGSISNAAYVFVRSGETWTQQAKLVASDGASRFGHAVSLSGHTALIGAEHDSDSGYQSGSAYVFARSGGVWTEQAKLLASDGAAGDHFGVSVSLSPATLAAETALIGAFLDDDHGADSGSAYVFVRDGAVWTEQAKLLAADGAAEDLFGWSVSVFGNTALIGAEDAYGATFDSGSAYVFARDGETWTQQAEVLASDGAMFDSYGRWVSLSGDTAMVGAPGNQVNGPFSGAVYVFDNGPIFADGFESGDTRAWSQTVP